MSAKISTEHKTKHVETLRVHPSDLKWGRNSRMIDAPNYQQTVTNRAISIAKHGQLEPCEARRLEDETLELVYGFTRLDAVCLLRNGFTATDPDTGDTTTFHDPDATVWLKVVDSDPDEAFLRSIKENQERADTTDLQEALAQSELRTTMGWTDSKIARHYGYTNQNRVMDLSKLLSCPPDIQQKVHRGELALSIALLGPKHKLTAEEQLKLVADATVEGGTVSGPALKGLLRDLLGAKAVRTPEPEESETEEGEADEPKEKKGWIKRNVKDLERFAQAAKDDSTLLSEESEALVKTLIKWFKGGHTDEYLRNALNEATDA